MVKNADKTEDRIIAVEEAFGKTEQWVEKNQRIILIVVGVLVVVVLGFFGYKRFYLAPKEKEAQAQMFMAEKYFEADSLNKALNGDGNYPGFLAIIEDYGITKSANLAKYYTGVIYLKKGEYQKAIDYLEDFSADDVVVKPMALGAIGDCYMELNQASKAAEQYSKAANASKNEFTTPMLLMKAGYAYEAAGNKEEALKAYRRIKAEFARTFEGRDIDKYISKLSPVK